MAPGAALVLEVRVSSLDGVAQHDEEFETRRESVQHARHHRVHHVVGRFVKDQTRAPPARKQPAAKRFKKTSPRSRVSSRTRFFFFSFQKKGSFPNTSFLPRDDERRSVSLSLSLSTRRVFITFRKEERGCCARVVLHVRAPVLGRARARRAREEATLDGPTPALRGPQRRVQRQVQHDVRRARLHRADHGERRHAPHVWPAERRIAARTSNVRTSYVVRWTQASRFVHIAHDRWRFGTFSR